MLGTDAQLYEAETAILALLVGGVALAVLVRRIRRARPDLDLTLVVGAAFAVRALVALSLPLLGSTGDELRGDDDSLFLNEANRVAEQPFSDHIWWDTATGELNVTMYALILKLLGGPGGTNLRIVQAALGAAAIALIALGLRELGGRRAALVAAWFLALEPSSVLFTTVLHKETLVLLGEAVAILGLARSWSRRDLSGVPFVAVGVVLAFATRSYAGGFLLLAATLTYAHLLATGVGVSGRPRRVLAVGLIALVVGTMTAAALSGDVLGRIQSHQETDHGINNNLQLPAVDFSTWGGLARGLPGRVRDFLIRPLPWQAENVSQALGVFTTLLTYCLYVLLALGLWRERRPGARRVAPFLYLAGCIVIAYALTTANAGTGFRHRLHLLVPLAGAVSVLFAPYLELAWRRVGARLSLAACLAALVLLLGSCGGGDENPAPRPELDLRQPDTPRAAVKRFLERVQSNAVPLVLAQYEPTVRNQVGLNRFATIQTFSYYSLTGHEPQIVSLTRSGATVRAEVSVKGLYERRKPFAFVLVRRAGRWRIAYDEITEASTRRTTWVNVQHRVDPDPPPGELKIGRIARRAGARAVRRYREAAFDAVREARS